MYDSLKPIIENELENIKTEGLYKTERIISSRQGREIIVQGKKVLNFCANNYLGLCGQEKLAVTADETLKKWGYGLSSVRFICGTQELHKELEAKVADFIGTEDAVLYSSCFMANLGLFQTILTNEDAIISDELNHASIIDGIRLCKAERYVFKHMDMDSLEEKLKETPNKRLRLIATDGVFSMDGDVARIADICDLADKYDALVMVDDAHATGFVGDNGRGTHELNQAIGRVDFITSTFGKALGGAGGAFLAANKQACEFFRQRSRTYLFSNSLDTSLAGVALFVLNYIQKHPEIREKLWENTRYFRTKMKKAGFNVPDTEHPIVPIMLGEGKIAQDMATELLHKGLYVIGFSYPVVPKGKARIRVQISASHTTDDLNKAIEEFTATGKKFGALN